MEQESSLTSVRIDKWLWAVRFFKTRSLAAENCAAGKVKRLGKSIKPSASVKVGDRLLVPTPDGSYKKEIEILQLFDNRVGAPLAQSAYRDNTPEEVVEQAKVVRSENRLNRIQRRDGDQGRMTKKQRRDWRKGLGSYRNKDGS
jgi:ribosome-associated heat shock protein Hsp15